MGGLVASVMIPDQSIVLEGNVQDIFFFSVTGWECHSLLRDILLLVSLFVYVC